MTKLYTKQEADQYFRKAYGDKYVPRTYANDDKVNHPEFNFYWGDDYSGEVLPASERPPEGQ